MQQMPLWVSHSSIGDFLQCPQLYYLRHVYKDPKTGRKINVITPSLALGNIVHEVLESLSFLPADKRFSKPLMEYFDLCWEKVAGKAGGFTSKAQEEEYKQRGKNMIKRILENPGPLKNKALKLRSPDDLPPRFLLSQEENILLCGKVDWLEYLPDTDSVHIIDFKTGSKEEKENSLQLPIYTLLVKNCQKREVKKISYWYLDKENTPKEMQMPDYALAQKRILDVALQIKHFRKKGEYLCVKSIGCFGCAPLKNIIEGKATFIRASGYQDIYANV